MNVDVALVLGAIIENSGGSYELPLDVIQRVAEDPVDRGITIDLDEKRNVLVLGIANVEDIALEGDDE